MSTQTQTLQSVMANSQAQISNAQNRYKRSKRTLNEAIKEFELKCAHNEKTKSKVDLCKRVMDTCRETNKKMETLLLRKSQLMSELESLQLTEKRFGEIIDVIDRQDESPFTGVFRGVDEFSDFVLSVDDLQDGFTIQSASVNDPELALGVVQTHTLAKLGESIHFCLRPGASETCGNVIIEKNGGLSFKGKKFKRV